MTHREPATSPYASRRSWPAVEGDRPAAAVAGAETKSIALDAATPVLLAKGTTYPLGIFYNERHTVQRCLAERRTTHELAGPCEIEGDRVSSSELDRLGRNACDD